MASPSKRVKTEFTEAEDCICGYIHNVGPMKIAARTGGKYFRALLQISRDDYRNVIVFAMEKRAHFLQAEKSKSLVKLHRIKRVVSTGGADFDVQCGRSTDMTVSENVSFPFREPPSNVKHTVAEVKLMAPRQEIGLMEAYVCNVKPGTEMIQIRGANIEMQTCHLQDPTGSIEIHVWDHLIGKLVCGQWYQLHFLSTREYLGTQFLTTTTKTEIQEIQPVPGANTLGVFQIDQEPIKTLRGTVTRAEIKISRKCTNCQMSQQDFNSAKEFHRCQRCNFLQKQNTYQPTASGRLVLAEAFQEFDMAVSNSVLMRYLQNHGLLHLLVDAQSIEEHLLSGETWQITVQSDMLVAIERVVEENKTRVQPPQPHTDNEVASATVAFEHDGV